ncbi:hypothetical protein [Roseimicrobium gellanilyticum]|nr:hypothetical protein [Roseimicrobium gellanilyticum]
MLSEKTRDIRGKTRKAHCKRTMRILNIIFPVIVLGCALALGVLGVRSFLSVVADEGLHLATPGFTKVQILKPGDYVLWNQVKTVQNGTFRTFPDEVPDGTKVEIIHEKDGSTVPWKARVGMRQTSGVSRKVSLGTVTFTEPGNYGIAISMPPEEGRSFSIEPSKFPQPFLSAIFGLLAGIFLGIGAVIWLGAAIILMFVRKATAGPKESVAPPQG